MQGSFCDEAIVLRTRKLSESDRIAIMITRRNGKLSAVIKGGRKQKSKYGTCFEPFMHVNAKFTLGRNLDYANEAEIIDAFGRSLVPEYEKYEAACQMVEILDKLLPETHIPSEQQYLLLLRALKMLITAQNPPISPTIIALSYILRALALSGWELDPQNIGAFGVKPTPKLPPEVTENLLEGLLLGDWQLLTEVLNKYPVEAELTQIVTKYAVYHLEKHLKSFNLT